MTPFLVVGMPRTGSTLLTTALEQHPDVLMLSELFHWVTSERTGRHAFVWKGRRTAYDGKEDALAFLRRTVWSDHGKAAAGFKLFAEHLECPGTERLFERIRDEVQGLRVVHVVRNPLDCWASRAAATATREWEATAPSERNNLRLRANPRLVRRFLRDYERANTAMAQLFAGAGYLRVEYDDLATRFDETVAGVVAFLGLRPCELRPARRKQRGVSTADQVENYAELRAAFAGTRFAALFGEPAAVGDG